MNQILSTENNNNNYNKLDTKKIIVIFCIAIIIVTTIAGGIKVYELISKNTQKKNHIAPEISIIREEETQTTISAKCEDGIDCIIYNWNDEKEDKVNLNGSKMFERIIDIPAKEINTLKVEVISVNGVKSQKIEEFEVGVDKIKPTIDSINIVDSKLQIVASDNEEIDYLEYQWEEEEPQRIYPEETENQTIHAQIDIQRGTHELKVLVADASGNEEKISKLITGVNEPEISMIKYGNVVHISVTHDMGFKKIEFLINNLMYAYDEEFDEYDKTKTTIEFDFPLKEGENIIQVNAYSLEKLSDDAEDILENYSFKTHKGKCIYTP